MSYFKPISISLSPNVEKDDVRLALKIIFRPWKWKKGGEVKEFEEDFKKFQNASYAVSFNSGRSALFAILKSLELDSGSEVLLQAFTCNAVPNPILWAGLEPVYVDCNKNTFNLDLDDFKRKITPKSKVIIVQHTFGRPVEIEKILEVAKANNLIVVEDCAHALGADFKGRKVGSFGKAAFFSFSRDKVISCIYGGITTTEDPALALKIKAFQENIGYPSYYWTFQQILHPILLAFFILPLYNFINLGKLFLIISQWLHILSKAVNWREKQGRRPAYFPKRLPAGLAILAKNQLRKIEKFQKRRKELADFYERELFRTSFILPAKIPDFCSQSYLRLTVRHKKAHEIIWEAWHKRNILIGDWYTSPVAPDDTNIEAMKYQSGSCPNAEQLSRETLNLPTHINISNNDAKRITDFLKEYSNGTYN